MKKKQNKTNTVSMVCEPQATYNKSAANRISQHHISNEYDNFGSEYMSVDEFFNILRTMVNEYYENKKSSHKEKCRN